MENLPVAARGNRIGKHNRNRNGSCNRNRNGSCNRIRTRGLRLGLCL